MHELSSDSRDSARGPLVLMFAAGVVSGMLFGLAVYSPAQARQLLQTLLSAVEALGYFMTGSPAAWTGAAFAVLLACYRMAGGATSGFRRDHVPH